MARSKFILSLLFFLVLNASRLYSQRIYVDLQITQCDGDSVKTSVLIINHTGRQHAVTHSTSSVVWPYGTAVFGYIDGSDSASYDFKTHRTGDSAYEHRFLLDTIRINDFVEYSDYYDGCSVKLHIFDSNQFNNGIYSGAKFILPIYFGLDSSVLSAEAKRVCDYFYETLSENPDYKFEIRVHFDERYPENLSTRRDISRAEAIRDYLVSKGIPNTQLIAKGYKDDSPVIRNAKTEAQHQRNRRVEITVLGKSN